MSMSFLSIFLLKSWLKLLVIAKSGIPCLKELKSPKDISIRVLKYSMCILPEITGLKYFEQKYNINSQNSSIIKELINHYSIIDDKFACAEFCEKLVALSTPIIAGKSKSLPVIVATLMVHSTSAISLCKKFSTWFSISFGMMQEKPFSWR